MIDNPKLLGLVADIGGTNARFALVRSGMEIYQQRQYLCADFAKFAALLARYLQDCGLKNPVPAVFAVAGPIEDNRCTMTNGSWLIDGAQLQRGGVVASCLLVNDFAALAASLPLLQEPDLQQIGLQSASKVGLKLVVGPGTGLGAAYLVPSASSYLPVDGEGGHMGFAPVDELDVELLGWFGKKYGRVSVERILSGPGLEDLHAAMAQINGRELKTITAHQIMSRGLEGEGFERDTLLQFSAMLGSFAGDLTLAGGCWGGVYIGGGIVPRMRELFATSQFRTRFEAKGRFGVKMKLVPSWLITHDSPALLGAASHL